MPLMRSEILTAVLMKVQVFGMIRRNCIYQSIRRELAEDFFLWKAPQQMLRTHRSLETYCATLWWRWLVLFSFFQVMEHRWNETDRGKPKYSGKTCPSATLSTTNPTWTDPGSNPDFRGERPASHGTASWRLECSSSERQERIRNKMRKKITRQWAS